MKKSRVLISIILIFSLNFTSSYFTALGFIDYITNNIANAKFDEGKEPVIKLDKDSIKVFSKDGIPLKVLTDVKDIKYIIKNEIITITYVDDSQLIGIELIMNKQGILIEEKEIFRIHNYEHEYTVTNNDRYDLIILVVNEVFLDIYYKEDNSTSELLKKSINVEVTGHIVQDYGYEGVKIKGIGIGNSISILVYKERINEEHLNDYYSELIFFNEELEDYTDKVKENNGITFYNGIKTLTDVGDWDVDTTREGIIRNIIRKDEEKGLLVFTNLDNMNVYNIDLIKNKVKKVEEVEQDDDGYIIPLEENKLEGNEVYVNSKGEYLKGFKEKNNYLVVNKEDLEEELIEKEEKVISSKVEEGKGSIKTGKGNIINKLDISTFDSDGITQNINSRYSKFKIKYGEIEVIKINRVVTDIDKNKVIDRSFINYKISSETKELNLSKTSEETKIKEGRVYRIDFYIDGTEDKLTSFYSVSDLTKNTELTKKINIRNLDNEIFIKNHNLYFTASDVSEENIMEEPKEKVIDTDYLTPEEYAIMPRETNYTILNSETSTSYKSIITWKDTNYKVGHSIYMFMNGAYIDGFVMTYTGTHTRSGTSYLYTSIPFRYRNETTNGGYQPYEGYLYISSIYYNNTSSTAPITSKRLGAGVTHTFTSNRVLQYSSWTGSSMTTTGNLYRQDFTYLEQRDSGAGSRTHSRSSYNLTDNKETSSFTISSSITGIYSFSTRAIAHGAGNLGLYYGVKNDYGKDTTGPSISASKSSVSSSDGPYSISIYADDDYYGSISTKYALSQSSTSYSNSDLVTSSATSIPVRVANPGNNYIHVISTDYAGNSSTKTFGPYAVDPDSTPPSISVKVDGGIDGIYFNSLTANISATDTFGMSSVGYQFTTSQTAPSSGYTTKTGSSTSATINNTGIFYLHATATDVNGNVAKKSYGPYMLLEDKAPPTVSAEIDGEDTTVYGYAKVNYTILDEISGVKKAEWAMNTSNIPPISGYTVLTENEGTIKAQSKGKIYIHIKAEDNAGNSTFKTVGPVNIVEDEKEPVIYSEWDGGDIHTQYNSLITIITAEDNETEVVKLEYAVSTSTVKPTLTLSTEPEKVNINWKGLGEVYIHAQATDYFGNSTYRVIGPILIKEDLLAPTLKTNIDETKVPLRQGLGNKLIVNAKDEGSGVKKIRVEFTKEDVEPLLWNIESNTDTLEKVLDEEGFFYIHVETIDYANNRTYKKIGPLEVLEDIEPPLIEIKSTDAKEDQSSILSERETKVMEVEIKITDYLSSYEEISYKMKGDKAYLPLPEGGVVKRKLDYSNLKEGELLEVKVEARDVSGNKSEKTRYFIYGVSDTPGSNTPEIGSVIELGGRKWIHIGNMNYVSKEPVNAYVMKTGSNMEEMHEWLNDVVLNQITSKLTDFEKLYLLNNDWGYGNDINESESIYRGKVGLITKSKYESLKSIIYFSNSWTSTLSSEDSYKVWKTYKSNTTQLTDISTNLSVHPVIKLMNGIIGSDGGVIMPPNVDDNISEEILEKLDKLELRLLGVKRVFPLNKLTSGLDERIWLSVEKMDGLSLEVDAGNLQHKVVISNSEILIDISGVKSVDIPEYITVYATLKGERVSSARLYKQEYYYETISF